MGNMEEKQQLGVVLVEDIPAEMADSEICQFFSHIDNVASVSVVQDENPAALRRFCWVKVKHPFATLAVLRDMKMAGRSLPMRLMGYLYPALPGEVMPVNIPTFGYCSSTDGGNTMVKEKLKGGKWAQNRMRQNRRGASTSGSV
ncbi:MAG: hypothetical protein KKC76_06290 [Proteobacteria bacterium]|nr:hypothetical protein [Pseudomonadota bacterium]MBU4297630.1 hypothetical protein [Pseudomonadota bacterium]MCG2750007.1 hypothetical protein [Desulfobulbaceae bacterium]